MSHQGTLRGICPNCGETVTASVSNAGRATPCPGCGIPVSLPAAPAHPLPPARPHRSPLVPIGLAAVAALVVIAAGVWVVARGSLSDRSDRAKAEALREEWAVLQKEQDDDQEYRKRIDEGKSGREYMTEKQRQRADRGFAILDEYKAIQGRHPDWQLPPLN